MDLKDTSGVIVVFYALGTFFLSHGISGPSVVLYLLYYFVA